MNTNTAFPALAGEVVTERHARICAELGHATHTVNGVETGICPRCGSVTEIPVEVAKFDRMIRLESEVRVTGTVAAMAPMFWERDRAFARMTAFKAELSQLFDSLTPAEMRAFGEYRKA